MSEYILLDKDKEKKIAWITLNRPEKLNALTLALWDELNNIIRGVDEDEDVKVLVLRGAGRAFCSGHDAAELGFIHGYGKGLPGERRPSQRERLKVDVCHFWGRHGVFQTVTFCKKATLASVHGYCYGGGFQLALECDLTIAAEGTLFTHPGWRYIGPTTDVTLLIATVGPKKAKEMMLTGVPLDAKEALEAGLVNKVVPLERLEEETNKMAETIALMPFDGIVMGKAHFEAAYDCLGVGAGFTAAYMMHSLQTNIRYEPDEYNLFRERRERGLKAALAERDRIYGGPYRL